MEPLGLPYGSVRALVMLVMTGVVVFLFLMERPVPEPLLLLTALLDGYYFGWRTGMEPAPPAATVEAPSLPPPLVHEGYE